MALYEHDGGYSISFQGQELMHSGASASELRLGELGVERLDPAGRPRVLIGGLGLGFTLKSTLARLGPEARVDVAELLQPVVDWNREHLQAVNGALLDDPRVRVVVADAVQLIRKASRTVTMRCCWMSTMVPPDGQAEQPFTVLGKGLHAVRSALKPGGRVVFWSAGEDQYFKKRLGFVGFRVGVVPAKVHERAKRAAYRIYIGDRD